MSESGPGLYDQLRSQVDAQTASIAERRRRYLQCRKGCDSCCHQRLAVLPVEYDRLRTAFLALPPEEQQRIRGHAAERWAAGICPLLVDGACSLYEDRPIICRTHGLPLYSEVGSETPPKISVCHLNFVELDRFDEEDLIDIDSVGLTLVGANQEYTKSDAGRPDSTQPRPMIEVVT